VRGGGNQEYAGHNRLVSEESKHALFPTPPQAPISFLFPPSAFSSIITRNYLLSIEFQGFGPAARERETFIDNQIDD
jgi:hypothetical protein